MGRLTSKEESEYNKRVSLFVSSYRKNRGQHSFSSQDIFALATQYGISNNNTNEPIDTKTLSALLKRQHPRVISAEEWRRERTIRFYDYLLRNGASPRDAKKYLSERFSSDKRQVTVSSITKILNKNGRGTYSPKSKAIAVTSKAQEMFESGQTIHDLIKETGTTVQELKKHIKNVKPELFSAMTDSWFDTTRTIHFRNLEKLTPENCHLWGLIWADGSISDNSHCAIRLNISDREYLEELAQSLALSSNRPSVIEIDRSRSKGYSLTNQVELNITSKKFCTFLRRLGKPTSSLTTDSTLPKGFKDWPKLCQFAFLRGFFEGDGSITYNPTNGHYNIFFALDSRIAVQLKTWLDKTLRANTHLRDDKSIKRLSVSTTRYVVALCLCMERASTIKLKRKTTRMREAYHHICGKYGLHHDGFDQVQTLSDDQFLDMINKLTI
ncbi:hypothetical protein [Vibrio sp.]|uniref:hypothetical protein n=1 Tax=Vibrio sp. TaxID=678 RepID=UPI003AA97F6C